MKNLKLLLSVFILLLVANSCKQDDITPDPINTDISVSSRTDLLIWLDATNLNQIINDVTSFNYGNAVQNEINKSFVFNSDTTAVTVSINFKEEFQQKYYDPNLSNNILTINLHKKDNNTGLPPRPSNYTSIPTASFPTSGSLPNNFVLDMPPAGNQGSQGSCTAWAVAYGMQSYFRKNEFNLSYSYNGQLEESTVCSPSYVYNQIKTTCEGGSLITDALNLLKNQGVCSLSEMPYNEYDCDLQPNQQQNNSAILNKIVNYETVSINSSSIKNAIYSNHPVVIAVHLYDGFYYPTLVGSNYVWTQTNNGNNRSEYHAMVVYGWDDNIQAFKVLNSWGNIFNDGSIWIGYELFDNFNIIDQAYIAYNDASSSNSEISISPQTLDFPDTEVNTNSQTLHFTVTNTGNSSFSITDMINSSSAFEVLNGMSTTINPNSSITFDVRFSPTQAQTYNGTIEVVNDADNSNSSNSLVYLSGTGVNNNQYSEISLSGNLNFGNVEVGQSNTKTFTISNTGNQSMYVSTIDFPSNVYSANWNSGTINGNSSQTVTITFQPTNAQSYNGNVNVISDAQTGNNTISISGQGVNSGQPNLVYSDYRIVNDHNNNNDIVEAGEDIDFDIQVHNIGNATAHNVEVYFDTNDSDINITDHSQDYGNVSQNSYDWNSGNLDFEVSPTCPTKTVNFTAHFTSDEGSWDDTFSIDIQGQSSNNPIPITPTNTCNSAPIMNINTVYEVSNFDFSQFGSAYPIDGESYQGGLVKGFYLSIQVPTTQSYKIRIFDVSSNFDPVLGVKYECNTGYYRDMNSGNIYRNDNGYGGNETFYAGNFSSSYTYNLRIYHYYGNDTPVISFKVEVLPN